MTALRDSFIKLRVVQQMHDVRALEASSWQDGFAVTGLFDGLQCVKGSTHDRSGDLRAFMGLVPVNCSAQHV